jgi:hypothetical protein
MENENAWADNQYENLKKKHRNGLYKKKTGVYLQPIGTFAAPEIPR